MGHLTVLEDKEQLLELALLIKRHEVEAIHGIEFGSELLISYEGGPLNLDYLHWIPIKVN